MLVFGPCADRPEKKPFARTSYLNFKKSSPLCSAETICLKLPARFLKSLLRIWYYFVVYSSCSWVIWNLSFFRSSLRIRISFSLLRPFFSDAICIYMVLSDSISRPYCSIRSVNLIFSLSFKLIEFCRRSFAALSVAASYLCWKIIFLNYVRASCINFLSSLYFSIVSLYSKMACCDFARA